jgi:hypothetical protein
MLTADHLAFLWISVETFLVFILWFMLRNSLSSNLYAIFIPRFAVIKCRNTIECHGEFGSLSVTKAAVAVSNGIHQTAAPSYLHQFLSSRGESASNWWLRPHSTASLPTLSTWLSRERGERQAAIYIRSFSYRAVDEERSQNDQSQQSRAGGSNDLSQSGNRKT